MTQQTWLTTQRVREVFETEVQAGAGTVHDAFDDGSRLFLRATWPGERPVRRGDAVQGGVALRAVGPAIDVIPYVFRQVCRNGAIRAHAIGAHRFQVTDFPDFPIDEIEALAPLAEAIRDCAAPEVFVAGFEEMRRALGAPGLIRAVELLAILGAHFTPSLRGALVDLILKEADRAGDRSAFGTMNAITAVARETRDPETRWRLEELGARVPLVAGPRSLKGCAARELAPT